MMQDVYRDTIEKESMDGTSAPSTRVSLPWMTKYEFDQLIGLRTMHLSKGAVPFVVLPKDFSIKSNIELRKIAIEELLSGKMPYIIERPMPDKKSEFWHVKDLNLQAIRHMIR
jgi:DNA-directed RNA polymerase subunit K/omega